MINKLMGGRGGELDSFDYTVFCLDNAYICWGKRVCNRTESKPAPLRRSSYALLLLPQDNRLLLQVSPPPAPLSKVKVGNVICGFGRR